MPYMRVLAVVVISPPVHTGCDMTQFCCDYGVGNEEQNPGASFCKNAFLSSAEGNGRLQKSEIAKSNGFVLTVMCDCRYISGVLSNTPTGNQDVSLCLWLGEKIPTRETRRVHFVLKEGIFLTSFS